MFRIKTHVSILSTQLHIIFVFIHVPPYPRYWLFTRPHSLRLLFATFVRSLQ